MGDLGPGQKPVKMNRYPHMMSEDAAVWQRYLTEPVTEMKRVWYDVHVGSGNVSAAESDEMIRRISAGVTRKRIDVVARVGGGYWVIELKPRADMTALGQALAYSRMFEAEYGAGDEVWPVVIAGEIDGDLVSIYDDSGVGLIVT